MTIPMFQRIKITGRPGNALTEYALIGALVLVGSIAALSVLGVSVNRIFSDMVKSDPTYIAKQQSAMLQVASTATQKAKAVGGVNSGASTGVVAAEAGRDRIQTLGANGVEKINANSAALFALAQKYEQTSPFVSNALIELGKKGQAMAQAIQSGDKSQMSNLEAQFAAYYVSTVDKVDDPNSIMLQLSAQDQQLVKSLADQSTQLTEAASGTNMFNGSLTGTLAGSVPNQGAAPGPVSAPEAAAQVNGNSILTIQCGQNLKCN